MHRPRLPLRPAVALSLAILASAHGLAAAQPSPVTRLEVDGLRGEASVVAGAIRTLRFPDGGPRLGERLPPDAEAGLAWVRGHVELLGLLSDDVTDLALTDRVPSPVSGVTHLYFEQRSRSLAVAGGQLQLHIAADGELRLVNSTLVRDLDRSWAPPASPLTASAAIAELAAERGVVLGGRLEQVAASTGGRQSWRAPGVPTGIEARRMLLPVVGGRVREVWNLVLPTTDGAHVWEANLDTADGRVWSLHDRVLGASFKVFPLTTESPIHASVTPPDDGRDIFPSPEDPTASPQGWLDAHTLDGNNVRAYSDTNADNLPDAGVDLDCGTFDQCHFPLDFGAPAASYPSAGAAELFFVGNRFHDVMARYGFDEAAGNFQVRNVTAQGLAGDPVLMEAQDPSLPNNVNMLVTPDGQSPRLTVGVMSAPDPTRDASFDHGAIIHELSHALSDRRVGGPATVSCLNNRQSGREGISDAFALLLTAAAPAQRIRSIGTYLLGQPPTGPGLRSDFFDGDPAVNPEPWENTWTYGSLNSSLSVYQVGETWTQAVWEVAWALIDAHGLDADPGHFTASADDAGNVRALYYLTEGLADTICHPTFTDLRDGILAAAAGPPYDGADTCRLWAAFAAFGLGQDATSLGPASLTVSNGFAVPSSCQPLSTPTPEIQVCAGTAGDVAVSVGPTWTPPVSLSLDAPPPGVSVDIAPNPLLAPLPATATVTVHTTVGLAAGSYPLSLHGSDGTSSADLPLTLTVDTAAPAVPVALSPADATTVLARPTLTWTAGPTARAVRLQIATDQAFVNLVADQLVTTQSLQLASSLAADTTYFWRLTATNGCGSSPPSAPRTFSTAPAWCVDAGLPIPDPGGVTSTLTTGLPGGIADLAVSLEVTHPYVGDLTIDLRHDPSGTIVRLLPRLNPCMQGDISVLIDDHATVAADAACTAAPAVGGYRLPADPLSTLAGRSAAGPWSLVVNDLAVQDAGTLVRWCLLAQTAPLGADGFETGNTARWSLVANGP